MAVTADGEIVEAPQSGARGDASRTVRIRGESVTIPRAPPGQRRRLVMELAEPVWRSCSKRTGASFASDRKVLAMIFQDTGHVFGDRSIARARRREAKRGGCTCSSARSERECRSTTIHSRRVKPNRWAGDRRTECGTVRVRFPDVKELRERRWREKVEARRRRRELAAAAEQSAKASARAAEVVRRPPPRPGLEAEAVPMRAVTGLAEVLAALAAPSAPRASSSAPPLDAAAAARAREVERQIAAVRALDLEATEGDDKPPDE